MPAIGTGNASARTEKVLRKHKRAKKVVRRAPTVERHAALGKLKTPVPKPKPAPVQRGHASEGPKVLSRKTLKPKPRRSPQYKRTVARFGQTAAKRDPTNIQAALDYLHKPVPEKDRPKVYTSSLQAPAMKVLEQTTRPLHAIAAATREDIKDVKAGRLPVGHGSLKAAGRGIQNKDKSTFSDVAGDLGVKNKALKGALGFVGDVALDPTTYLTGGTATIARRAALKASRSAEKKALAKGLTQEQAKRFGERAAKQATKKASPAKGVVIKAAGHEVPGVRRVTAKAAQPVRKVTRRKDGTQRLRSVRAVHADVNPNVAPAGVPQAVHEAEVVATRKARAKTTQGEREAINLAAGIKARIGEKNYNAVVDAIESGNIKSLPEELRQPAVELRSHFKYVRKVQRQAGVKVANLADSKSGVKGYVYRQLTDDAVAADEKKAASGFKATGLKPSSSKVRKEKRPLSVVREEQPGRYREDLHALAAERMAQGTQSAARAGLNRDLASIGRDVTRGKPLEKQEGEAVFHIKAGNPPREVTDKGELARITAPLVMNKKGTKLKNTTPTKSVGAGRYVVLNREVVKRAQEGVDPMLKGPGIIHALDKGTSVFKRIALATPGFHLRNLVGDTQQAYISQPGRTLPGNLRRAGKVLHEVGREEKAARNLERPKPSGKTMPTGRYGHQSYEDIARNLINAGAARSGYTARELRELSKSGKEGKLNLSGVHAPQSAKRLLLNREDLPRLATAIHALRKGATWDEAATLVSKTHYDYGHLTNFERQVARRLMPFYTWSARNIPFQTRSIISKPGKYANFQKIREEAGKATSPGEVTPETRKMYAALESAGVKLPGGYEKYLSEWEQRNVGIPISWKGHKFTVSAGLPIQDLNEFPGAALANQFEEYYQKGMSLTGPIPKDFVEFFDNHSFFFRDQLERDHSPTVAAPVWVKVLPAHIKKLAGVTPNYFDPKTGKKGWGWRGKADYVFKSVPGTPKYIQDLMTQNQDRRGKGTGGKLMAWAGLKSVPINAEGNAVNLAYERLQEIGKEKSALNQQHIGAKYNNITPNYRKLLDQEKLLKQITYQGKAAQNYAQLPTQGGPSKKIRPAGSIDMGGSSSSAAGTIDMGG